MNIDNMATKKLLQALKNAFDKTTPMTEQSIKKELATIKKNAVQNWPVRQRKYGASKGSKRKIKTDVSRKNQKVDGSISNLAGYAWAIRAGKESKTSVKPGKRIADELLYKPAKKAADRIAKKIANDLINNIRRI